MNLSKCVTKINGRRFAQIRVELYGADGDERLSITGMAGRVLTERRARAESQQSLLDYFSDPDMIIEMNHRMETRFTTARGAAKFVEDIEGPLYGIDALDDVDNDRLNGRVLIIESCGCIHDELAEWFPECQPHLKWHLNHLRPGCEHQDALGWGKERLGKPCPECGYAWGSAWLQRKLPAATIEWVQSLPDNGFEEDK